MKQPLLINDNLLILANIYFTLLYKAKKRAASQQTRPQLIPRNNH